MLTIQFKLNILPIWILSKIKKDEIVTQGINNLWSLKYCYFILIYKLDKYKIKWDLESRNFINLIRITI